MIKLFEMEDGVVKPTAHCEIIIWLKAIQNNREKKDYIKIYAYLFYMACPSKENPFFHLPDDSKEDTILRSIDLPFEETQEDQVIEALKLSHELYRTPTVRAYYGIKIALDNMADYMASTVLTDGKDGNITQVKSVAKDFDGIRQSFKGVAKDLEEEQESHVRGNQNLSYDQIT